MWSISKFASNLTKLICNSWYWYCYTPGGVWPKVLRDGVTCNALLRVSRLFCNITSKKYTDNNVMLVLCGTRMCRCVVSSINITIWYPSMVNMGTSLYVWSIGKLPRISRESCNSLILVVVYTSRILFCPSPKGNHFGVYICRVVCTSDVSWRQISFPPGGLYDSAMDVDAFQIF